MTPRRFTFVLPGFLRRIPVGGVRVTYEFADRLSKRGHAVTVVHPIVPPALPWGVDLRTRLKMIAAWIGRPIWWVTDVHVKPRWFEMSERVRSLLVPNLADRFLPDGDAIVATAWSTAFPVAAARPACGAKAHYVFEDETIREQLPAVVEAYALPLRKVALARWTEEKLRARGADVAGCVPVGLDATRYRVTAPIEPRRGLAMMYSAAGVKACADGFAAMARVRERFADVTAEVYGAFDRPADLPAWADYRRSPSDDEVAAICNRAAIFISSSRVEGWGLPGFEAMGCGCALVSTDHLGVREYAAHGREALLSPPGDPAALAENVATLLSDPVRRVALARAGAARASTFTWDAAVDRMEAFLVSQVSSR